MEDEKWMQMVAEGDTRAFGEIVRGHQPLLLRFAERMLGDADAAQDAVQEAFLRLWRMRARYRAEAKLSTFLLRVVRNICLDLLRACRPTLPLEPDYPANHPGDCRPDRDYERRSLAEAVRQAVQSLPELQRAVFVLSQYEQLSYREIASVLDCPVGTVASRKAAAVETLRRRLAQWKDEG